MRILRGIVLSILMVAATSNNARAQITGPGDIAFSGYISSATDEFSFVLLNSCPAGFVIHFTDNGWLDGSNPTGFRTGETTIDWTAPAGGLPVGTEIGIAGLVATRSGGGAAGTVTGTALNLSAGGDQIFAYIGTAAAPTFLSGIHMNVYTTLIGDPVTTTAAGWDPDGGGMPGAGGTGSGSAIPPGLINGVNAVWIGTQDVSASEFDNASFACGPDVSTVALARAALNNQVNWTLKDNNAGAASFTLPTNCGYAISALAVKLISFSGKLNPNKSSTLQWTIAEQQSIREFIVDKSIDGISFTQLGTVKAQEGALAAYTYTDMQVPIGNNYYRLRIVEQSGKVSVSNIIVISLKADASLTIYPNPVKEKLIIQQFGGIKNKTAVLYDGQGTLLQQILITKADQPVNMSTYAPGIYILKLQDGTIFRILKQ